MYKHGAIILLFLALTQFASAGDITKKLPSMLYLARYGCTTGGPVSKTDYKDPMGRAQTVWVVRAYAEHKGLFDKKAVRDWQVWLADSDSLEDGNKVCIKWMKRIRKASYNWKLEQKVKIVEPKERE